MSRLAKNIIAQAKAWLGCKESDGSHKKIIDIYNNHRPLARGYKVKHTDAWCATFVSACAIKCGYTDIIPTECGCDEMIKLFKKLNSWVENDSYIPKPGDIIFYDWQDNGIGDNIGAADHVGIVENVINNVIVVIEGNKNNAVERREIQINGRYIRGFGVPKYTSVAVTELTTVNDIVWELAHRGILTDKQYWLKKLAADKNVYCLAKNMANYRP
jgi:hypothetical protein